MLSPLPARPLALELPHVLEADQALEFAEVEQRQVRRIGRALGLEDAERVLDGGAGRKLWDYLPHFTAINYAIPVSLAFVRGADFDALSEPLQREVMAAAAETEQSQFDLLANRTAENYARMRANGVSIIEPAPVGLIAALREAARQPIAAWKAKTSPEAVEIADWAIKQ